VVPREPGLRVAVQQEQGRPVTAAHVVDADAVDFDFALDEAGRG
jgi:hypothetical protein